MPRDYLARFPVASRAQSGRIYLDAVAGGGHGRDRVGICPLYWTRQAGPDGEWLLFASEIKALLASGMVEAKPDPRGVNHLFTFFALPGPVTCFQGVQALTPGQRRRLRRAAGQRRALPR